MSPERRSGPAGSGGRDVRRSGGSVPAGRSGKARRKSTTRQSRCGDGATSEPSLDRNKHRKGKTGEAAKTKATVKVRLTNRYGLHMRPAKEVVELANSFPCDISLIAGGREVDAKSILALIGLGAECGDEITVQTEGRRAEEAAAKLGEMLGALPELHGEAVD